MEVKYLKGYLPPRGPVALPNATQAQKDELRAKGIKVADISDAEAAKIKREIGNR